MNGSPTTAPPPVYGAGGDPNWSYGEPTASFTPGRPGPSRRPYAVAAIVAAIGVVIGVAGVVSGLSRFADKVDRFSRAEVPGSTALHFSETGDFTIYYEAAGANLGDEGSITLPPVEISMASEQDGEPVPLSEYGGSFDYSVNDYHGTAVATFHIDSPGAYVLGAEGSVEPGIGRLAVGRSLGNDLAQTLVPTLVAFLAVAGAAIVAIVTAVRRRRTRSQHRFTYRPQTAQ